MTEADRIRSMGDAELATYLCNIAIESSPDKECSQYCPVWDKCYHGHNGFLDVLGMTAKEG